MNILQEVFRNQSKPGADLAHAKLKQKGIEATIKQLRDEDGEFWFSVCVDEQRLDEARKALVPSKN
jgi:hypothetical protein